MVELEQVILHGRSVDGECILVDYTTVFGNPEAMEDAREYMYQMFEREVFDAVVMVDSAGAVFASSVATRMHKPLVLASERDSMVGEMLTEKARTWYGEKVIRMADGSISAGKRVVIICDELAHGEDVAAAVSMVRAQCGTVVKIGAFVEHSEFGARRKLLKGIPLECRIATADL